MINTPALCIRLLLLPHNCSEIGSLQNMEFFHIPLNNHCLKANSSLDMMKNKVAQNPTTCTLSVEITNQFLFAKRSWYKMDCFLLNEYTKTSKSSLANADQYYRPSPMYASVVWYSSVHAIFTDFTGLFKFRWSIRCPLHYDKQWGTTSNSICSQCRWNSWLNTSTGTFNRNVEVQVHGSQYKPTVRQPPPQRGPPRCLRGKYCLGTKHPCQRKYGDMN